MKDVNLEEALQFSGTWRSYQKRVLDNCQSYMKDRKIHIVAPPGSGKTTLGIELIRRLGQPCLILSPSIVIRQQWVERIQDAFLTEKGEADSIITSDIRRPAAITAITYQALHAAMSRLNEAEEDEETQAADYSRFDLLKTVKKAGLRTICLDECHHLRSEWWKALETFMGELGEVSVVSLTATPPYDSTPAQWERYITMCGGIDEEITVPELVKERSLCPHQDYVYFNYPSHEEEEHIQACRREIEQLCRDIAEDERFVQLVASHRGIMDPGFFADSLLEDPPYLASILIFMEHNRRPYPKKWLKILGVKKLPGMQEKHLERLLQGALFDDAGSYDWTGEYQAEVTKKLKRSGCIEKRKVSLSSNETINKLLVGSIGKLNSIEKIVLAEHKAMGGELRLLILTDYIRKEYLEAVGNPDIPMNKIGVVPLFEQLRRNADREIRLGVLCGSIILLPCEAADYLQTVLQGLGAGRQGPAAVQELTAPNGQPLGYCRVAIKGTQQDVVRAVTKVFEAGYIKVLIGTKALLGEGWDSPCINSLILASFVGSFVLSNQMRGRAIRFFADNPSKTSNIWHLVCLEANARAKASRRAGAREAQLSEDFAMLSRRMKGFLGLSYDGETIESGIGRLGLLEGHFTEKEVKELNKNMLSRASDREGLLAQWEQAMVLYDRMEVVDESEVLRQSLKPGAAFFNLFGYQLVSIALEIFQVSWYIQRAGHAGSILELLVSVFLSMLFLILTARFGSRLAAQLTPLKRLKTIGEGIKDSLIQNGQVISECRVVVEEEQMMLYYVYLMGGTAREKSIFADCVEEFFQAVDNQRYLLYFQKGWNPMQDYFCVPGMFSRNKEDAGVFQTAMNRRIGNYRLIYTRNEEGRRVLQKARKYAYANQIESMENRMCGRKKKVKSPLE